MPRPSTGLLLVLLALAAVACQPLTPPVKSTQPPPSNTPPKNYVVATREGAECAPIVAMHTNTYWPAVFQGCSVTARMVLYVGPLTTR